MADSIDTTGVMREHAVLEKLAQSPCGIAARQRSCRPAICSGPGAISPPSKHPRKRYSLNGETSSGTRRKRRRRAMDSQWRNFLLAFAVVAVIVTPAFGQAGAPSLRPTGSGEEGGASIPDFSGVWVHPLPGFEPLPSGPTALVNRSRRPNGTGDILKLAGDHTNPILKSEAVEVVKRHGELGLNGIGDPNPRNQCWPAGVPFVFTNGPTQLLQQPDKVTILYGYDHQVRHVRLNQPHPAQVTPSWYGDSVGHYEGDTLVVDTVGIKVGPFAMVDFYGTPYTEALHVVERYRLLDYEAAREGLERDVRENRRPPGGADAGSAPDYSYRGKHLQLQFTVEDEGVFTMPWSATITYRRGREAWREVVCTENTQELMLAGRDAAVPRADRQDF